VRKIPCLFLIISFFIVNLNLKIYASPEGKNDNTEEINKDNQQIMTKENIYNWEFSSAVSLGIKLHNYGEYETFFTTTIPVRIGFIFPLNIIEVETEANFMYDSDYSKIQPFFLIHIIYNFKTSSRIKPFLLVGGGTLSERVRAEMEPYEEFRESYFLWNAGVGFRRFIKDKFALRLEYRFIYYNALGENIMLHSIFFGGSLFF